MLEDLPKVAIMEDEDSNIHMRNLSIHRANNEEEALNLVWLMTIPVQQAQCAAYRMYETQLLLCTHAHTYAFLPKYLTAACFCDVRLSSTSIS